MKTQAAAVVLLLAFPVSRAAATPAAVPSDRRQVQAMLIEAGYSAVAMLRLVNRQWTGVGAHDGVVVDFIVDAASLRLIHEAAAH